MTTSPGLGTAQFIKYSCCQGSRKPYFKRLTIRTAPFLIAGSMECPWAIIKSKKNNLKINAVTIAKKTAFVPFISISYIIPILFFVDKPSMSAIIEKQHVAKRRKRTSFKPINKSADFNAGFMSQFRQKPVQTKKDHSSMFSSTVRHIKTGTKPLGRIKKVRPYAKKRASGSGFSVPFLPTLAVIAGTVVIALAALNWEEIIIKIPEDFIYQSVTDNEAERHTMIYASTGITMPAQNTAQEEALSLVEETPAPDTPNDLITFEWQQYKVKRGDSVSKIAQNFGVSVGAIIASNEIRNARTLQEGAALRIPNIDGIPYQVKNGDNLKKIALSFNVPLEVILDVNDIKNDNIKTGETLFIPGARMNDMDLRLSLGELFVYPVQNKYITSHYGMRKDPISGVLSFHTGIDLRADTGTNVTAALDGVVSVITENWLYGKYIIITHNNGYKTLYGHLNSYSVKEGDTVARGKKIGESGNTGYSTGPHLHFSIYDKNNKFVNPLDLLR